VKRFVVTFALLSSVAAASAVPSVRDTWIGTGAAATATPTPACVVVRPGVYVDLPAKDDETIRHERDAVSGGQPRILHWDPEDATAHRAAALRGVPKVAGKDLDEYPPAASREGGSGSDVRAIDPSDNRSAGATMSAQMRPYCDGQAFILEP
jgi:hypothetical protein